MSTWRIAAVGLSVATLAGIVGLGQTARSEEWISGIRAGDRRAVETALRSGSNPNVRDKSGATPLMLASAFGDAEMMLLLLDRGADPKLSAPNGVTPLMWATHDPTRVKLLVDRGAEVNAATRDGVTPLITAAMRGNAETMRLLLAAGADVKAGTVAAPWPMTLSEIAFTTNDSVIREILMAKGVRAPKPPATAAPNGPPVGSPPLLTRWLLTSTFSWRLQPAASNANLLSSLLDAGADANETVSQLTLTVPALSRVVRLADVEAARVILERGANPNTKGSSGWTPLMMAAATDHNARTVQLLVDKGARVNERDDAGRTALDWALMQGGDNEAASILRRAGGVAMAAPVTTPKPVSTPRTPRSAIELALTRLQPASKTFNEKAGCISCHNQSLSAIAVKAATNKGVKTDAELTGFPTAATFKMWGPVRENLLLGNCGIVGFTPNVTYGMLGLAEEGVAPTPDTDAVAACLSGLQQTDGSWIGGGDSRPPLSVRSPIIYTALTVRALKTYMPAGRRAETNARIARAREFLRKAIPYGTQEEALKLLGLIWSAAPSSEITAQSKRLLSIQGADGGWSQYPAMAEDSYQTGQALYALHVSGLAASSSAYQKGAQYLLRTQLEDGTWYLRSRAMGFQPYVETGFPHGPDQFISSAATSWAVIALSYTL